jgi:adenylate kinase family enzyme
VTKPLIDYYKKQGILENLDSDGSIDEMHQKVSKLLVTRFKE